MTLKKARGFMPRINAGVAVSVVCFAVVMIAWAFKQVGGFNTYIINSFLELATTLVFAGFGVTLVLIIGDFDLSVGGVITVTDVFAATHGSGMTPGVLIAVTVLFGLGIGLINGIATSVMHLNSIAATLASYIILSGVGLVLLPEPGGQVSQSTVNALTATFGGVSVSLYVFIALGLFWILLRRTRYGVGMFAVGADETAATLSGVPTRRVKLITYSIAGVMYALGGLFLAASTGTGDPGAGTPFLLTAFAAVALGGTSFAGGQGSAIGTIVGALALTAIPKALFAYGMSDFFAGLLDGVVILAAVLFGIGTVRIWGRGLQDAIHDTPHGVTYHETSAET